MGDMLDFVRAAGLFVFIMSVIGIILDLVKGD